MMATGLADWLRAAGLRVEEVAGWQDRGHGELQRASGIVVVNHHTAGGPYGRAPSLSTCLYGVPGVPGPLCNVMQTREPDGNDAFLVIAAGISYNAGTGGWGGVSGNWNTIGLEVEHTGIEPYPDNRAELTQRFNAAVLKGLGQDTPRTCQHFEWSDTGKIDIGTPKVDADWFRERTQFYMQGGAPEPEPTPPPEEELPMELVVVYTDGGTDYLWVDDAGDLQWRHVDTAGTAHPPKRVTVNANENHRILTLKMVPIPGANAPVPFVYFLGPQLQTVRAYPKGWAGWVAEYVQ